MKALKFGLLRGWICIVLMSFNLIIYATDYYVRINGNDANSGLSDAQAWAHHPWMKGWTGKVVLKAGDNVYLKRGDKWTTASPGGPFIQVSQSGTVGHPITTSAYGTGPSPVINVSTNSGYPVIYSLGNSFIIFENLDISHFSSKFISSNNHGISVVASGTNVPHDWIIRKCEIHNIPHSAIISYPNCYNMIVGDTTIKTTATTSAFSNHVHDFGYAGIMLQGVNPSTLISNNYICYNYVHDATRTNVGDNEYGVFFTVSSSSAGWPKYCYGRFNNVQNIKTWEGMDIHSGSHIYFTDNYIKNFGTVGIHTASTKVGTFPILYDHIYIERNILEQPSSGWVSGKENCFILHFDSEDAVSSEIYIRNNKCFYTSRLSTGKFSGIRAGNTNGLTISGNEIFNGATSSGSAAILLTDNYGSFGNKNVVISGNSISDWAPGIIINGPTVKGEVSIINNIITKTPGNCITILNGDIPAGGLLNFYFNTLLSNGSTCLGTSYGISSQAKVNAVNNIIGKSSPGTMYYWYWGGTISGTFNCNYNLYWNSSGSCFYKGGAKSWSQWRAMHDLNSPNTKESLDPLFINTSGSYSRVNDFNLKSESPAIKAGSNVGISEDYLRILRSGHYDIGALQYIANSIPVTEITISGSNIISSNGGTSQLTATVLPTNATIKTVKWSIANGTGKAGISSTGLVTAIANGTVTATATATDGSGVSKSILIQISNQITLVTNISVTGSSTITTAKGQLQLSAAITPENATNPQVVWSIVNGTGKATINQNGLVTASANGTVSAKATATDGSGVSGLKVITISNQPEISTGITVSTKEGSTAISTKNGQLQLIATLVPQNITTDVNWSIINGTGQASINSDGLVTAMTNGNVTAKATTIDGSGLSGTLSITITGQNILVTKITINSISGSSTIPSLSEKLALIATITPDNADNIDVTWSITNGTGKASISSTGIITPVSIGTVTAIATANDGSKVSGTFDIIILEKPESSDLKTKYIDPTNNQDPNQDGSLEHPFSSWDKISWKQGFTYLQKKGTLAHESSLNITADSIIIGAYGSGNQPVIESDANDYVIKLFEKSALEIQDIHIKGINSISCIYILGETCSNIKVSHCILQGSENGIRMMAGKDITIRYNTILECSTAIYSYAEINAIYYNIFKMNTVGIFTPAKNSTVNICNNVFYDNNTGISNTYSQLTLYNNIFYFINENDIAIDNQLKNFISDHNIFYPAHQGFIKIAGKVSNTLKEHQNMYNQELKSLSDDPLFSDHESFSLEAKSPAINRGKTVGLVSDFKGSKVPSGGYPDIGIIEIQNPKIDKSEMTSEILVYPNPCHGIFTVSILNKSLSDSRLSIQDISGKTVFRNFYGSDREEIFEQFDSSNFHKGMYIIVFENNEGRFSKSIVID